MAGSWHVIKIRATAAAAGRTAALKVSHTRAGPVLASSRGRTLYYYSADKRQQRQVGLYRHLCYRLAAAGRPGQGPGGRPPAGQARRHHPARTASSRSPSTAIPLYFYIGDKTAGQVTGNGIGGAWHVIKIKA